MSLLGKLGQKIGNAMEKSASKNMSGASKEAYEKERREKEEAIKNQVIDKNIEYQFTKEELKNLELLLMNTKLIDELKLWVAGLPNFKVNQNSKTANLFSGKKNHKFFSIVGEVYYLSFFDKDFIKTSKIFRKKDIAKTIIKSKFLGSSTFRIEFKDGKVFTIDVTDNKDKLDELSQLLK